MNFHEIRFPTDLSFGSIGGPERRTEIVSLTNGYEERNSPWSQSRHRFDAGFGMRSLDDLSVLIDFFEARSGQLFGFRWKDWANFKSCLPSEEIGATDQVIGVGDNISSVYQLVKRYTSGDATQVREIAKPVLNFVKVAISGDLQVSGTDYEVNFETGEVTFTAPPPDGALVTAGFEFDVPVRFDTDRIESSVGGFSAGEIPSVPVVEVRV
ncbi:glycoside hydrolase family 24 [Rhodobacterales bacterium 52_120_T64]|nr:glycoside hydrolase family 24 [Rhodobacterales bacterium 52_120_T64]